MRGVLVGSFVALLVQGCGGASERSRSRGGDEPTAAAGAGGASECAGELGELLVAARECGVGEQLVAEDQDGDAWIAGPSTRCVSMPLEGWTPACGARGFDCADRAAGRTQLLYRVGWRASAPGVPLPTVEQRCLEDEDTEGFEPLDRVGAWGGYGCGDGFRPWGRDFDGDGVMGRSNDFLCLPSGAEPPTGYTSGLYGVSWEYQDCDDEDATLWAFGYSDADGDGYTNGGPRCLVPGAAGAVGVFQSAGDDCDDADAGRFQAAFVDADLDGARSEERTCVGAVLPPGVLDSSHAVDCDDADAGRAPSLDEVVADGADQDCDGTDAPSCDQLVAGWEGPAIPRLEGCAGADLYVVWARGCPVDGCGVGTLVLQLGNRGNADFDGEVRFELEGGGTHSEQLPLVVPAGEHATLSLSDQVGGEKRLRLEAPLSSCSSDGRDIEFVLEGGSSCRP